MRKFIGLLAVAVLVWVAAAPAEAVTLQEGENYAKLVDYSSFFNPATNTPGGIPDDWDDLDPTTLVGAELRAIFYVTGIANDWSPFAPEYWTNTATDGTSVTGLLYDLVVAKVTVDADGSFKLELTAGGRYTSEAETAGAGGRIDMWVDTSPNFDHTGGPTLWSPSIAGHDDHDDYPTVSDVINTTGTVDPGASLWLRAEFVPTAMIDLTDDGPSADDVPLIYTVTMDSSDWTGKGKGFAEVTINNTNLMIAGDVDFPDALSPVTGGDLSVVTNLTLAGSPTVFSGWQVQSNDPVEFYGYVPEPASMSLLVVGLVGSAGAYWRRRRAA
jgi:hypothetical protein